jgi:NADH-quinone oxidoreductase subunit L
MEGPTPVSALIHAATMVTAGVYMVCRSHIIFERSGVALEVVAWVGVVTAVFAATVALVQTDIKRVLAYSTISQLGYMFAAAGLGAYASAIFHLVTHAFFKALLFLGAGSVIHGLGGEQDLRKMGGLAPRMVVTTITMLVGTAALAGLPPFAGFFSKDEILSTAFHERFLIWPFLLLGAFLTAFYSFRLFFLAFLGAPRMAKEVAHHVHEPPRVMTWPLIALALLTAGAGMAVGIPSEEGSPFHRFLGPVFGVHPGHHGGVLALALVVLAVMVSLAGLVLAAVMYWSSTGRVARAAGRPHPIRALLLNAYYVDALYDRLFVRPFFALSEFLARTFDVAIVDGLVNLVGRATVAGAGLLRRVQTGYTVTYALTMLVGVVLLVGFLLTRP